MARNQYIQLPENQNIQIKSLTIMRNSTLLCRRALLWIASLMLDIQTIILN